MTRARFAAALLTLALSACGAPAPELAQFAYPPLAGAPTCPATTPPAPNRSDDEITPRGIKFSVRAPSNYAPTHRHALLVAYAPAGYSRRSAEAYYALTRAATAAGFIVTYADHARLSAQAVEALGAVPAQVVARWCIDPRRVYFAGHSDGGSYSMGVTFMNKSALAPVAIVASGAGIRGSDLAQYQCPKPTAIRVLHSAEDERFPGFGAEAAQWWAKCNRCAERAAQADAEGCYAYQDCAAATQFCPTHGPHARWPATPQALIGFLTHASVAR